MQTDTYSGVSGPDDSMSGVPPIPTYADAERLADAGASGGLLEREAGLGLSGVGALAEPPREWLFPGADHVFRGIYTRAGIGFSTEVMAVSSALAGEGKTSVAIGLATTVAQDFPDRRVLVVETDAQRPALADDFGLEHAPGLIECIITGEPLQSVCRPTYIENLHVVPVGGTESYSGRPLRSSRIAAVVDAMRQMYDLTILDLPPILVDSDALLLSDLADGAICVVRSGVTPMSLVNKAIEQLEEGKLRGIVLNGTRTAIPNWIQRLMGFSSAR